MAGQGRLARCNIVGNSSKTFENACLKLFGNGRTYVTTIQNMRKVTKALWLMVAAASRLTCIWYVPFGMLPSEVLRSKTAKKLAQGRARKPPPVAALEKPCGDFAPARHSVLWGGVGRKARHGRPRPFGQMRNRSKLFDNLGKRLKVFGSVRKIENDSKTEGKNITPNGCWWRLQAAVHVYGVCSL